MAPALVTQRLRLEKFDGEQHLQFLADLASKPEITHFIGSGETWTRSVAEQVAENLVAHWENHGSGWRVAQLKATGEPVGIMCSNLAAEWTPGLAPDEQEIGWWLKPDKQGEGLASEGACAVRDEAFDIRRAVSVVACIHPDNRRSVALPGGLA